MWFSMYYRKITFWLIFSLYWCNGDSIEFEQFENVRPDINSNRNAKENLKSTYSVLSESISQAVKDESNKFFKSLVVTI